MRALVLLLLGGGLLWFVLRNFGSTRAEEAQDAAAPAGFLLPPPEAGRTESVTAPRPAESVPEKATEPVTAQLAPERSSESAENRTASQPEESTRSSDEGVALSSQLLHHTHELAEQLRGAPGSMRPERRDLVLAFCAAIEGDLAEARRLNQELEGKSSVTAAERALLSRVLEQEPGRPVLASVAHENSLAQAATMALLAKEGAAALQKGQSRDAARVFSDLLLEEIHAPWKSDPATMKAWTESLRRAQAGYQWNRSAEWPSVQITVEKGDSLISIRKRVLKDRPDALICTGLIERANEVRGGVVHPGQVLRIPTERAHMLVALDSHWAFFMLGDEVAAAWEVGVGKAGSETRPGNYSVGEKSTEPMWFRPGHKPVPFGDPENPLGTRWIAWRAPDGSASGLGFHGTKDPESVGQDLSQGCVRMLNRDVEELYEILPKDAAIVVQP